MRFKISALCQSFFTENAFCLSLYTFFHGVIGGKNLPRKATNMLGVFLKNAGFTIDCKLNSVSLVNNLYIMKGTSLSHISY